MGKKESRYLPPTKPAKRRSKYLPPVERVPDSQALELVKLPDLPDIPTPRVLADHMSTLQLELDTLYRKPLPKWFGTALDERLTRHHEKKVLEARNDVATLQINLQAKVAQALAFPYTEALRIRDTLELLQASIEQMKAQRSMWEWEARAHEAEAKARIAEAEYKTRMHREDHEADYPQESNEPAE